MALFTQDEVRARARQSVATDRLVKKSYVSRSAEDILREATASFSELKSYDVFLSHSIKDGELVLGIKEILEDLNYTVYVDWIEDPEFDRTRVTPGTANQLRRRMMSSRSLLYVTTENAETSKWMPWECGYFDGLKEKVAIVPVKATSTTTYTGQEYLGLYPYCVKEKSSQQIDTLWIHKDAKTYTSYDYWVKTKNSEIQWKTQL